MTSFCTFFRACPTWVLPVRYGRAALRDPEGAVRGDLAEALVHPELLPPGEHLRLALRKVGLHGEGGFRQVQRGFVVHGSDHESYHGVPEAAHARSASPSGPTTVSSAPGWRRRCRSRSRP